MKYWDKFEEWFILFALAIMGIVLTMQVFARYVMNYSLIWSEELARYIFVWITFIGAGYGIKNGVHIKMELFYNKFPSVVQKLVTIITNIIAIFCFSCVIPYGIKFTISQQNIASSAMGIPMNYVFAAVPIGCSIIVIKLLADTIQTIKTEIERRS